jgi:hypothetical protein
MNRVRAHARGEPRNREPSDSPTSPKTRTKANGAASEPADAHGAAPPARIPTEADEADPWSLPAPGDDA